MVRCVEVQFWEVECSVMYEMEWVAMCEIV